MRFLHGAHPALVHFPIALLGTSLVFDLVGLLTGSAHWWAISFWNMVLGLSIGALTATTGLIDSTRVKSDSPASAVVSRHMFVILGAVSAYFCAVMVRFGPHEPVGMALVGTLALEVLGAGLLTYGGWLGGELVYRHGVGREPQR